MTQPGLPQDDEALATALRRLLEPLAKLAVGKGLTHAAVDEWLRAALVREAFEAHPDIPATRRASRISASTGLHRREVQRLLSQEVERSAPQRSLAAEVFAHWRADANYVDEQGAPKTLPRTGSAPSFESLAQAVTRDMHPRSLLEVMVRLGVAEYDARTDQVRLVAEGFVPNRDQSTMLQFLGDNVGDHLAAAVDNVTERGRHFEQAVFADGLSPASVDAFKKSVGEQWQALAKALVPQLEALIERDDKTPGVKHRVRLGLYGYDEAVVQPDPRGDDGASVEEAASTNDKEP